MLDAIESDKVVALVPQGFRQLLAEMEPQSLSKGELLKFNLGKDSAQLTVYNPVPVVVDGQTYIWARVESKTSEKDSAAMLFKEDGKGEWSVVKEAPVIKNLQDPFDCGVIDDYHILGGVQVRDADTTSELEYRTIFYRYQNSLTELTSSGEAMDSPFAFGPSKTKDIRLIQIESGRIGVFTRPQGEFGGRGHIGYFEISSLDQLEASLADYHQQKDPHTLIGGLFVGGTQGDEEWGGVGQLHLLPDGKIGVLGHVAGFGDESYITASGIKEAKKDYYPITFIFDPVSRSISKVQIIATADQFPSVEAKKEDLGSILYAGGLVRLGDGTAWLYAGIGDSKAGRILVKDPFWGTR